MRKIKFVSFHTPLFVPGIGSIGDSLPSPHKTGFEMCGDTSGIQFKVGNIEGFIPATQCKIWIYGPEEKVVAAPKVAKGKG